MRPDLQSEKEQECVDRKQMLKQDPALCRKLIQARMITLK